MNPTFNRKYDKDRLFGTYDTSDLITWQKENVKIDAKNLGIYHLDPILKITGEVPDNVLLLLNHGEIIRIPFIQH